MFSIHTLALTPCISREHNILNCMLEIMETSAFDMGLVQDLDLELFVAKGTLPQEKVVARARTALLAWTFAATNTSNATTAGAPPPSICNQQGSGMRIPPSPSLSIAGPPNGPGTADPAIKFAGDCGCVTVSLFAEWAMGRIFSTQTQLAWERGWNPWGSGFHPLGGLGLVFKDSTSIALLSLSLWENSFVH